MLLDEIVKPLALDAERAHADSLFLWRSLIMLPAEAAPLAANAAGRCALDLSARYRLGDGDECAGEVAEISPLGLRVVGPRIARPGDRCVANVSTVGIVEGLAVQGGRDSFVLALVAPTRRLRRLAKRLNWQLRRIGNEEIIEQRSSERVEMNNAPATIQTSDGRVYPCGIFDLSANGAAVQLGPRALDFFVGQPVKLLGRAGHVVRYFSGGAAIQFQ